jgi:hypothetical protein
VVAGLQKKATIQNKECSLWQWDPADMIQEIHMEDRCIIPLVPNAEAPTIT